MTEVLTLPEACALARVFPDDFEVHLGPLSIGMGNGTDRGTWGFMSQEWRFIDKRRKRYVARLYWDGGDK